MTQNESQERQYLPLPHPIYVSRVSPPARTSLRVWLETVMWVFRLLLRGK